MRLDSFVSLFREDIGNLRHQKYCLHVQSLVPIDHQGDFQEVLNRKSYISWLTEQLLSDVHKDALKILEMLITGIRELKDFQCNRSIERSHCTTS